MSDEKLHCTIIDITKQNEEGKKPFNCLVLLSIEKGAFMMVKLFFYCLQTKEKHFVSLKREKEKL